MKCGIRSYPRGALAGSGSKAAREPGCLGTVEISYPPVSVPLLSCGRYGLPDGSRGFARWLIETVADLR
jgi:hypothetical protein